MKVNWGKGHSDFNSGHCTGLSSWNKDYLFTARKKHSIHYFLSVWRNVRMGQSLFEKPRLLFLPYTNPTILMHPFGYRSTRKKYDQKNVHSCEEKEVKQVVWYIKERIAPWNPDRYTISWLNLPNHSSRPTSVTLPPVSILDSPIHSLHPTLFQTNNLYFLL